MVPDLKIQIKENKDRESLKIAPYILTYEVLGCKKGERLPTRECSYSILSMLKRDNDMVIEVNSRLMNVKGTQRQACVGSLIDLLKEMDLTYRYRKTPGGSTQTILSLVTGKKEDDHEILAYIPDDAWNTQLLRDSLPLCGARYYVCDGSLDPRDCLDNFHGLSDDEKLSLYKMSIFDPGILERVTINSKSYNLEDLKRLVTE